jgi:hypothetical protein
LKKLQVPGGMKREETIFSGSRKSSLEPQTTTFRLDIPSYYEYPTSGYLPTEQINSPTFKTQNKNDYSMLIIDNQEQH